MPLQERLSRFHIGVTLIGRRQFTQLVRVDGLGHRPERTEERLQTSGRDEFENSSRFIASVPEGVPLTARFEDEIPRTGFDLLIAQDGANPAMHDVGELVLEMMSMHGRGQRARSEEMLHQGEPAASVLPIDHEAIADSVGIPDNEP